MPWEFQHQALPAFHDHGWKRDEMAAWDDVWAAPVAGNAGGVPRTAAAGRAKHDPPAVVLTGPTRDELRAAGLAEAVDPRKVSVAEDAVGFARRLQALRKGRLLDPAHQDIREYVRLAYVPYQLTNALDRVAGEERPA